MQSLVALLLATVVAVSANPWGWNGYPYYGYGGLANPVVLPSGYLADTPEVASAKATHSARLASAAAAAAAAPDYDGYGGPVVTPAGFLADTPEVAAAKARHFAELARAGAGAYAPYAGYPYAGYPYAGYPYAAAHEGQYAPDHNGW
uniref:Uncharacterized protein n=1 Tax=Graphocephala atropunctata TaxID=36148 RepID=A0A1B6M1F1_9HEMI